MGIEIPKPPRVARRPVDSRGYPIPYISLMGNDGSPLFTINDDVKGWEAFLSDLCPICGERLGRWRWFVGGPGSAFDPNGWYLDLPMHIECCRYALQVCPYLALPRFLKRLDVIDPGKLPEDQWLFLDETIDPARPEVFVALGGDKVEVTRRDPLLPYQRPLRPLYGASYWRAGVEISAEEALPAIRRALRDPYFQLPAFLVK